VDEITLRPATADDLAFFFALHKESLGPYVDQVWGWEDDDQRAYLERNLVLSRAQVVVVNGADVGRLDVEDHGDERFLALIEIAPEHRERGIGGRLIHALLEDAFTEGKRVRLSVLQVTFGPTSSTGGSASPRCYAKASPRKYAFGWWRSPGRQHRQA
jgi:GNAT superfamily N-acetyltransferase